MAQVDRGSSLISHPDVDKDDEAIVYASVLTSSFIVPMVLNAAIELGVLDTISEAGPEKKLSSDEIASIIGAQNPCMGSTLDRMLRLLATHSVLNCSTRDAKNEGKVERVYGLTPVGRLFVQNKAGGSLVGFLGFSHNQAILDIRHYIKDAVLKGGIPFKMAHGVAAFEYMRSDPEFSGAFNTAVSFHSSIVTEKILKRYTGFEDLRVLIDVGGGRGTTLNMIVSKYPHIKGINFDLPQVIQDASPFEGIEHIGGDMFKEVPRGEAILLKRTCHNWSDEKCLKLLKNCHEALEDNGKLIIIDSIMSEGCDSSLIDKYVSHYDNIMFTQHEGKERTEKEFRLLGEQARFMDFRVVGCACAHWVMELRK
ncbi:hypothetical protein CDL15_Pgr003847 [Punica granatum]|uniref:Caffeic acid 3-O-methyltransferase-like n=1 Tax=Punica granatum TaxID=22663 RepID=A0A218XTF3_PUNGR|nr:hypothetical protein CDL15_Pgr003847 [Punica granatum]